MKTIRIETTFDGQREIRKKVPNSTVRVRVDKYECVCCTDCYLHLFHPDGNEDPSPGWTPEKVDHEWPAADFDNDKPQPDFSGWDLDYVRREVDPDYLRENPIDVDEDDETVADDAEWWAKYGARVRAYLETWWEATADFRRESYFSWGDCDVCGSTLGGDRYPVTACVNVMTITGPEDEITALKP